MLKITQLILFKIKTDHAFRKLLFPAVLASVVSIFISVGCNNNELSDYQKANIYCLENNGIVRKSTDANGNTVEVCKYKQIATYDDGDQTVSFECDVQSFYKGTCADSSGQDQVSGASFIRSCPTCPKTVREMLYDQVEDILLKINNTGYTHKIHKDSDGNNLPYTFDLHPNYTELTKQTLSNPIDKYDLFLDCSGFVGYYVVQGIAGSLYKKLPSGYSCEDRPLAADFVDHFETALAFAGNEAADLDNVCWSRVDKIQDALPGDVIAYKHEENIGEEATCPDNKKYHKVTGNTGHVLFIHDIAYQSAEKKDVCERHTNGDAKDDEKYQRCLAYKKNNNIDNEKGRYQWVVAVADSTTAPHMFDSRKAGEDNSIYGSNYYHAWTKEYNEEKDVQRCPDGSYHRKCDQDGTTIIIDTIHKTNPTGIGVGRMYINEGMDGYRNNYSNVTEQPVKVRIGRPVPCQ